MELFQEKIQGCKIGQFLIKSTFLVFPGSSGCGAIRGCPGGWGAHPAHATHGLYLPGPNGYLCLRMTFLPRVPASVSPSTGVRGPSPPSSSRPGPVGRQDGCVALGKFLSFSGPWPGKRCSLSSQVSVGNICTPDLGSFQQTGPMCLKCNLNSSCLSLLLSSPPAKGAPLLGFTLAVPNTCSSVSL